MSYTDTGYPAVDGLEHLRVHLESEAGKWEVKEVVDYNKADAERINPPIIQIEPFGEAEPEALGVGGNSIALLHMAHFRIWYFSSLFSAQNRLSDLTLRLSQIRQYLIENPEPDSYGHLYTAGGEMRLAGFNIVIGPILAGSEMYSGGYIDVYLHKVLTHERSEA